MITKDDFEQWRDNAVTQEVFKAFELLGERAKQDWISRQWDHGDVNPVVLADLRARHEVVNDFREIDYETIEEWLDYESQRNPSD